MDRSGIFETIVGIFVVGVAVFFMNYAVRASGQSFANDQYTLEAVFGRVDGVTVGSDVRIAGVKVGTVSGNQLDFGTYEANLSLAIEAEVPVPDDSVAKIVSDGILGGAHVAIEPGASFENLIDGDRITITQGSVDLLGLAVQAFTSQSGGASEGQNDNSGQTELDPLGDL